MLVDDIRDAQSGDISIATFADRGEHALRGVDGQGRVLATSVG